jgi:hypothetical protein
MMKRSLLLVMFLTPMGATAGLESMLNPMLLANPIAPTLGGFGSPLGGFGSPLGGFGSPLGGFGSPLGVVAPVAGLGGLGAMYPAMQVAPNLMSFQHQAPQMLTNPYMGGPFSQLPNAQANRSAPFGALPYGTQAVPYGYYTMPAPGFGMAYPGSWGTTPQVQPRPANPYLPFFTGPSQTSAPPQSAPAQTFNPLDLLKPAAKPTAPAPANLPLANPWGQTPAATAAAAPQASLPAQTPPAAAPLGNPWLQPPAAAAKPVTPAAAPIAKPAEPASTAAPTSPFDPAYWLAPLKPPTPSN